MLSYKKIISILLLSWFLGSCSNLGPNDWTQFVPDEVPFIVVPEQGTTLHTTLNSQYLPLIDDISSSSIALMQEIDSTAANSIQLKSILLYPGIDQKLQPVWIAEATSDFIDNMKAAYHQLYGQQYYFFEQVRILKMRTDQRTFYAAKINDLLLLSESSVGIENAIRVYRGEQPGAKLADTSLKPGSLVMNTPALEEWLTQQAKVTYYKNIQHTFAGTLPTNLTITHKDSTVGGGLKLTGTIPFTGEPKNTLVKAISTENASIELDDYISFDASAFAFLRIPPIEEFPESLVDTTSVDSFMIQHQSMYTKMSNTLGNKLAIEFFAKSGFRSIDEHAFIRKIKKPDQLNKILAKLVSKGLLEKVEKSFFVRSRSACRLIGSTLCNFSNFYLKIVDGAIIMAPRRGLVEMVASDYKRRQTVVYETFYKKIKKQLPKEVSGLVIGGKSLVTYLKKFLKKDSYIPALTSRFDYVSVATVKKEDEIHFELATYNIKSEAKPFIENWVFPIGTKLSGPPVFADVQGSANEEIIFTTQTGSIFILSADGSLVEKFTTGGAKPVGSPVAYDWYSTGQKIIMIAAGNKIYAWDEGGNMLPQFPFTLNETITAPLAVTDVNSNGLADVIVATANRKLHVLNARGNPLFGWPVQVNAVIQHKPLATQLNGRNAVVAFASNAVHAWSTTGKIISGFPHFIGASFVGSPVVSNDEIIGAAANGKLYAIGSDNLFDNSLSNTARKLTNSGSIEMLSAAQSSLFNSPYISQEGRIAVMSVEGTIYFFENNGNLLFTKSMGQAPAKNWTPVITDINSDKSKDIVALAGYGRIYAWDIQSGERIHQLPTTAMSNVTIEDIDGDGLVEIVGQTENGIVSWTIH